MSKGRDVLIHIIRSEIPKEKMTPRLKQILSERTYLKWEGCDEGEKYFWRKLRLALSKRKRRPTQSARPKLTYGSIDHSDHPLERFDTGTVDDETDDDADAGKRSLLLH